MSAVQAGYAAVVVTAIMEGYRVVSGWFVMSPPGKKPRWR